MFGAVNPIRVRVLLIAVLCFVGILSTPAVATPGSYHLAVGGSVVHEPGVCRRPPPPDLQLCPPERTEEFAIDASDQPGAHGSAVYRTVIIPLTCVVIKDTADGHTLYAAGTSQDGATYLIKVVTDAVQGEFYVASSSTPVACGSFDLTYGPTGYGAFVIAPVDSAV